MVRSKSNAPYVLRWVCMCSSMDTFSIFWWQRGQRLPPSVWFPPSSPPLSRSGRSAPPRGVRVIGCNHIPSGGWSGGAALPPKRGKGGSRSTPARGWGCFGVCVTFCRGTISVGAREIRSTDRLHAAGIFCPISLFAAPPPGMWSIHLRSFSRTSYKALVQSCVRTRRPTNWQIAGYKQIIKTLIITLYLHILEQVYSHN